MNRSPYVLLKWLVIILAVGALAAVALSLASRGYLTWVVGIAFVAMCILVVYGPRKGIPMKYLLPGILLALGLQIFPIVLTVMTSFSNYGDGHQVSKEESVKTLIANSVQEVAG